MTNDFIEVRPTIDQLINIISQTDKGQPNGMDGNGTIVDCPFLMCQICKKSFKNRGSKRLHMEKKHNQQMESMNQSLGLQPGSATEARFFCPFINCESLRNKKGCFKSVKLLVQHFQKTHHEKSQKCLDCSAKFALERDLRYHRKKCQLQHKTKHAENIAHEPQINHSQCPCSSNNIEQRNIRTPADWLTPAKVVIIRNFKAIRPRKTNIKKNVQTQTNDVLNYSDNGNIQQIFSHNENTPLCYPYGTQTFTVDQGAQVQMDVCNVNSVGQPSSDYSQQYQHSYSQTIYPQTIDFGAQYPATVAAANYSADQRIYLTPLQVASTQTQISPISDTHSFNCLGEGSNEIQTTSIQRHQCEYSNQWTSSMEMNTVAAQTELASELDSNWFLEEHQS